MAKATLSFDLPEEQDDFTLAKNGGKYYCILCDIQNIMRDHTKYDKKMKDCWVALEDAISEFQMDEVS